MVRITGQHVAIGPTRTALVAQFERLRDEHVELERQFVRLREQWPVNVTDHKLLLARLAAHRRKLRQWRHDLRTGDLGMSSPAL